MKNLWYSDEAKLTKVVFCPSESSIHAPLSEASVAEK